MEKLTELMPMLGLRISAGPIELRGITDEDLPALCDLAARGIHAPYYMPFLVPWSRGAPDEIARRVAAYHWRCRGTWSTDRWSLQLGAWHEGTLIGCQGFDTVDYLLTRTGETGSWLGLEHQNMGLGTAMRQVLCAFVFDHLDAEELASGAWVDNPASLAVSRKVGYRANGQARLRRESPEGESALEQKFVLAPGDLVRYEHRLHVEGVEALRRSIGLDPIAAAMP